MRLTVDASVFVSAVRLAEVHHAASYTFLAWAFEQEASLFCPTLVLPECAAAIARPTGDAVLAEELTTLIEGFPHLRLVVLDIPLAHRAAQVATVHRLRGADSVYVAVADAYNTPLITWDTEMLQRGRAVVSALTPAEWLEQHPTVRRSG